MKKNSSDLIKNILNILNGSFFQSLLPESLSRDCSDSSDSSDSSERFDRWHAGNGDNVNMGS